MVGETPPQWSRDTKNREEEEEEDEGRGEGVVPPPLPPPSPPRHATHTVEKKNAWCRKKQGLAKNHFLLSERILPWDPRSRSLHWPIAAVLDCSNPIEITTRRSSVEKMPTHHRHSAPPALAMTEKLFWTPPSFCIYVASLTDSHVCHLIFVPHKCIFPRSFKLRILLSFVFFALFYFFFEFCINMLFLAALIY